MLILEEAGGGEKMFGRRFMDWERHSRLFEKGDLKFVVLDLLKDKPAHGYEVIRELEERFHGFYTPSAGSVYPTLQLLEDLGYVKAAEQDGKKVYTITDAGRKFLQERGETVDKIRGHMSDWWKERNHEDFKESLHELRDVAHLMARKASRLNKDRMSRIKEIISQACKEIEKTLAEE
jgi:DNA-binding PadR family transcriptional regulator